MPPLSEPGAAAKPCPKCHSPLPVPKPATCPQCGANLKPLFGPVLPGCAAFLLGLTALGAGALALLVSANDALTYGNANAQGSGNLFAIAFVCGAASIAIKVWLIKGRK